MPAKNAIKVYVSDSYYHIYNRGVEKRTIFEDTQDYKVFLSYIKYSLLPPPKPENTRIIFALQGENFKGIPRLPKNFSDEINLLAYCLMPNHFHLLVKQKSKKSIEKFTRSIITRYSMYFNKKYERVGSLFQGPYKAILITEDAYLLHLSRYIHLNPSEFNDNLINAYSSYTEYLGLRKTKWVKPKFVLDYFNKKLAPEFKKFNSYKDFVEKGKNDLAENLGRLTL